MVLPLARAAVISTGLRVLGRVDDRDLLDVDEEGDEQTEHEPADEEAVGERPRRALAGRPRRQRQETRDAPLVLGEGGVLARGEGLRHVRRGVRQAEEAREEDRALARARARVRALARARARVRALVRVWALVRVRARVRVRVKVRVRVGVGVGVRVGMTMSDMLSSGAPAAGPKR